MPLWPRVRERKWTFISLLTSVGTFLLVLTMAEYLYHFRGIALANSSVDRWLGPLSGASVFVSFITALVGAVREDARWYGVAAVAFSILSFFFYVR